MQSLRYEADPITYSQGEPPEKRQRTEAYDSSYFGVDLYTSTAATEFPVSSLVNSDPGQSFGPYFHLPHEFEESFWPSLDNNAHQLYYPIIDHETQFPTVNEDYSSGFESSNNRLDLLSSFDSSVTPLSEQLTQNDFGVNNFFNNTIQVEDFRAYQNDSDVCFGMIADVPFASTQPPTLDIDTVSIPVRLCLPFNLYYLDRHEEFGKLDERTSKILSSIGQEKGISFEMYCRSVARAGFLGKRRTKKGVVSASQFLMNVVLFGPEDLCDVVGKYFAKCGIHLQDPLCSRDVVYRNPHILSENEDAVMTSSLAQREYPVDVENVINEEDIFSKLSNDDHLSLADAPDAIQTPLYSHQKKALTFMTRREQGRECDGSMEDLWIKEVDETGQLMYTNVITESSQKEEPPDCRGGLLADQMGLGKTLTMISHIVLNPCNSNAPTKFTSQGVLRCTKSTLIVVPFTLLEIWDTQLKRHLKPDTLKWIRFHGIRKRTPSPIESYDIVITTFETLIRQRKKHLDKTDPDSLFSYSWHRIVLDEAHIIRNRTTAMAQTCCAVKATNRWAITGTPIQNRATDLGSLLEFLQVHPFSNPKLFDTEIIKPWLKSPTRDISRLKRLINSISLSRSKAIINLPKREDKIYHLDFSTEERDYYEKQKKRTIQHFSDALSSCPPKPGQYLNALQWLNELRLICNHGLAHSRRKQIEAATLGIPLASINWTKDVANKAFETLICAGGAICSVCCDVLSDGTAEASTSEHSKPILTSCLNLTCGSCVHSSTKGRSSPKCSHSPPCPSREVSCAAESAGGQTTILLPGIDSVETSTKLKALLKSLNALNGEKSVVFSYWTYTLDLVGALLDEAGIKYTRIDGQRSGEKREQANTIFQNDKSVLVILISITCGGAGLDLTAASRAYLLDPQWNPQMEEQALSRIHRLGQLKEVQTIRFRMRNSIEEKVVKTQEEKKDLAAKAFSDERYHGSRHVRRQLLEFQAAL